MGASPATFLVLFVLLILLSCLSWIVDQIKESEMKKQHKKSDGLKPKVRKVKSLSTKLTTVAVYFFNTLWTIDTGLVAAIVSPLSTH